MNLLSAITKISHNLLAITGLVILFIIVLALMLSVKRRRPQRLNAEEFRTRWHELQRQCASKSTWPLAIIDADKLLDTALKQRRFKGKTMGERLVAAQHEFTDNESLWHSHKLRNKLVHEDYKLTRKADVKVALLGYLQALKDIGALRSDKE